MATDKTAAAGNDAADAVENAGKTAGAKARRSGEAAGAAIDDASESGARTVRRASRKGSDAYDAAAGEFGGQVASLEDTIRQNPLAAAGAALLVGVVLGRFVL